MNFTSNLVINIYSITLLILIYIHTSRHSERAFLQQKLFTLTVQVTILLLIMDILSRLEGNFGMIYYVGNYFGNFMVYLLNPVIPSLWLLYAYYQVFHDEKGTMRWLYPLLFINVTNVVLVVLSQFFGWFYYIDSQNVYHRGRFFWLPALITIALTLVAFVLIISNRKRIEKKYYFSLVFFPVPPFICIFLQIIFYGMSLMLNSVALSLLIVFINIQNQSINTDYLTGVYNRKKLEAYLKEKISTCTEEKTFSAILLDLNNFKSINDTFGHDMGDWALETSAKLLKSCLKPTDFIARLGGDEFYIILDLSDINDLNATVCKITRCFEKYNELSNQPFKLGFSIGYAVYDYHSHMKVEEFEKQIDILMYENKWTNKEMNSLH